MKKSDQAKDERPSGLEDSDDLYGTLNIMEVDSDVNEDRNREALLDQSLDDFCESVERGIREKEAMTNVPAPSVFDVAVELDEVPEEEPNGQ